MQLPDTAANRNAFALAGLRIAVACLFLIFGQYKVFGTQFTLGGGFQWWINRFLQGGAAYPFMVPVLQRCRMRRPSRSSLLSGSWRLGWRLCPEFV